MNWTLLVSKPGLRSLGRLPAKDQLRIERVLDELAANPFSGEAPEGRLEIGRRLEICPTGPNVCYRTSWWWRWLFSATPPAAADTVSETIY